MLHSSYKYIARIVLLLLVISAAIYIGFLYGKSNNSAFASNTLSAQELVGSPLLGQVKSLIDEKFISWKATYTPPTTQDLEYGMIRGYVSAYHDPYTQFFPPKEAKEFNEQVAGEFSGVGMEVESKGGFITVVAPLKDSPAQKAGIQTGDIIVSVDGENVEGVATEEVVSIIRGEIGTDVTLGIARRNKDTNAVTSLTITITRAKIQIPTVDTEIVNGVFVIHLYNFSGNSAELFRQALVEFTQSNTMYLLIDVRGNPGGYLEAAVDMASLFLPKDKVVVVEKGSKSYGNKTHTSKGYNVFSPQVRIAVLIDEGSASASEILAGALKDHGLAKVYGQKSFGKGSVQELVPLPDGSSIKITVATWYTPNDINITLSGITPDVDMERNEDTTYDSELQAVTKLFRNN